MTGTFTTAVQVHTPLEPHACVARWDTGGDLHLHLSTQSVGLVAEQAAKRWNLPAERVHVVADHVGGGFGAKNGITAETIAAVELARACGAPVRVVFSRADELTDAGNRPGTRTTLELLTDDGGDLAALTVDVHGRGGVSVGSAVAAVRPSHVRHGAPAAPRLRRHHQCAARHAVPRAGRRRRCCGRWSRPWTRSPTAAARTRSRCAAAGTATPSGTPSTTGP